MYRFKSNLLVGLLVVRTFKFLPEFLFRPPSGATFPPGEGIGFACIGRFLTICKNTPLTWRVFCALNPLPPGEAMGAAAPEVLSDRPIRTPREGCPYNPFFTVGTPVPGCPVHRPPARPGCFAEATKKFLFPISFLLNSILWKTLVFSTGMC